MNEINTMQSGNAAQNTPFFADFEQEFRRTIWDGNKNQVNKFPESMPKCGVCVKLVVHIIGNLFTSLTDSSCNS